MPNAIEKRHYQQTADQLRQLAVLNSIVIHQLRIPERGEAKSAASIGNYQSKRYRGLVLTKILPLTSGLSRYSFKLQNERANFVSQQLSKNGLPTISLLKADYRSAVPWVMWTCYPNKTIGCFAYETKYLADSLLKYFEKLRQLLDKISADGLPGGLFPQIDLSTKIKEEYVQRKDTVINTLGEEVYKRGLSAVDAKWPATLPLKVVHNDLSPQNILATDSGFIAIDWDNALIAPAFVDWATIWMFACQKPEWAEQIYQLATRDFNPKEKRGVNTIFLTYGYRLLAYYAETYLYALRVKNRFQAQNKAVLESGLWALETLEKKI